ncbi:hypothetical protein [Paracoccus sp. Ld10]|uniref:hypothetical protein n=1 Tax=Paracoccus sp. Ld10 TaxID=649158 RepID=UPI00386AEA0E
MFLSNAQHESRWQAVMSISAKIGCAPQILNEWVGKVEVDSDNCAGIPADMFVKMKALERERLELRQGAEGQKTVPGTVLPMNEICARRVGILQRRSFIARLRDGRVHQRSSC